MIDGRAIINPSAQIGENVTVGPWTIIGPDVTYMQTMLFVKSPIGSYRPTISRQVVGS